MLHSLIKRQCTAFPIFFSLWFSTSRVRDFPLPKNNRLRFSQTVTIITFKLTNFNFSVWRQAFQSYREFEVWSQIPVTS